MYLITSFSETTTSNTLQVRRFSILNVVSNLTIEQRVFVINFEPQTSRMRSVKVKLSDGRIYINIDLPVVRLGGLAPARPINSAPGRGERLAVNTVFICCHF